MSEQTQRVYTDPWYAKNRSLVIERQHRRHLASIQRLSVAELAECQQDPTKVWTVRGPGLIACIETGCGELHKQLGHHLRVRHGLRAAEYKAKLGPQGGYPRYNKNASLLSIDLQKSLSKIRRKLKLGERLQGSGTVPPVKKLIASRSKRTWSQQRRIEHGRKVTGALPQLWGKFRGKSLAKKTADWEIAKLATDGTSHTDIAALTGLSSSAVWARLRRIGFSGRSHVCANGQPLLGKHFVVASEDFNKTRKQLADYMGLKPWAVCNHTYGASLEKPLPTELGRAFKVARKKLREEFRHRPANAEKGGAPPLLLPSERDGLPGEYRSLLLDMKAIINWLSRQAGQDSIATFDELREWVYLEARKGRLRRIAFWPDFLDAIRSLALRDIRLLRGGVNASDLTRQVLAQLYGVSVETVRRSALLKQ